MRTHKLTVYLLCFPAFFLFLPLGGSQTPWSDKVAPTLRAAFDKGETTDALLVFSENADLSRVAFKTTKREKAELTFLLLQNTADRTQARARTLLQSAGIGANSLFITNAIAVEHLPADVCRALAELPEIKSIEADPWIDMNLPGPEPATPGQRSSIEWGVARINAPAVWAMGYTGQGITVGGADTGFDWVHPAIQPHYRGWDNLSGNSEHNYNWHDAIHSLSPLNGDTTNPAANPCGLNSPVPCDDQAHGTHTMGTMTGDDGQGNQIGVAPGARWVGCRNMERGWGKPSSYLECFQWFLAPTDANGANPNPAYSPDVINNSWYCAFEEGCTDLGVDEILHNAVINLRTAGVVVVVSNGNSGSSCATTNSPPAYFEESFSIGSFRDNDTISGFSSRGPVLVDNSFRIKPNVAAPGSNVRSCTPNNGYASFSGTSMAGPHVVGLVALMLSANPELKGHVEDVESIIEQTAIPTDGLADCSDNNGLNYPNNTYGYGRVDALAAVNMALNWSPSSGTQEVKTGFADCYPNPATDQVFFDLHFAAGRQHLEFFDATGKKISEQFFEVRYDRQILPFPLSGFRPGVYWYKISGKTGVMTGKMVKM